jgi:branched-chain amino acid transport system permease protein
MNRKPFLVTAVKTGALATVLIVYFVLVGMIERFDALAIVGARLTLSWVLILAPPVLAAYIGLRPKVITGELMSPDMRTIEVCGIVAGAVAAASLGACIGLVNLIGIETVRSVFVSVSPAVMSILTLHMGTWAGVAALSAMVFVAALAGANLRLLEVRWRRPLFNGIVTVVLLGLLQRIVPTMLRQVNLSTDWLYSTTTLGLTVMGAGIAFVVAAGITLAMRGRRIADLLRPRQGSTDAEHHPLESGLGDRKTLAVVLWVAVALILVVLPYLVGPVVSRILGTVGIFLLLGLGLNIVVGYAGLLDLGYVAFFAVGAYFTAILTGGMRVTFQGYRAPTFGAHLSFYVALPIVVVIAALIGVLIGAPVLRLRGDYLAIVTLGFGEIARVIFGSTWAQGLFGGSLGMSSITAAPVGSFDFQNDPRHFYYLALVFCALAVYLSWRLQDSRVGRAWSAMREDEQVANVMGISTVRYKLLAFAMGGAIGSVGGAIFAVSLGSLTIASFNILVSITALAVIIFGGMGSIPGVVVGAVILIGLPGVLTEFEDYQLLIYGVVLIAIMLLRPQGLVPNVRRSRELQEEERAQDQWAKTLLETDAVTALEPTGGDLTT